MFQDILEGNCDNLSISSRSHRPKVDGSWLVVEACFQREYEISRNNQLCSRLEKQENKAHIL